MGINDMGIRSFEHPKFKHERYLDYELIFKLQKGLTSKKQFAPQKTICAQNGLFTIKKLLKSLL